MVELPIEAAKAASGDDNVTVATVRVLASAPAGGDEAGAATGPDVSGPADSPAVEAFESQEDSAAMTDASPQAADKDQVLIEAEEKTQAAPDPEASPSDLPPMQDDGSTS